MTDEIELNCGENEITEVPESEQVVIKVESPPPLYDFFEEASFRRQLPELIGETSVPRQLTDSVNTAMPLRDLSLIPRLIEPGENLFRHLDGGRKYTKLSKQNSKGTWSDQTLAMLITVMGLFAGAAYMVLFSFHDAFPISAAFKGVNLSIWELLTFPRAATEDFLVITTVTTTFILSMGMNTIALCIFFRKFVRGTFLTILSLFTIAAFSLSFFAMLSKFIPHHIIIAGGSLKIPATFIVMFYDIYVIILVCAFAYTVHWWRSSRRKQDAVTERKSVV